MLLVKVQGEDIQYPYPVSQLKADNPNTSFSQPLQPETLASMGVYEVVVEPDPSFDRFTQKVVEASEPVLVDGVWTITKTVEDLAGAEAENGLAELASVRRSLRDEKLAETDHYGLSDVTMSDDMATYRQALRDVPQQESFPQEVTWPILDTQVYDTP
tara:strand:+ start:446 stop:919 length:474 start_codon:yes stop_codon:yes gene_type:complete